MRNALNLYSKMFGIDLNKIEENCIGEMLSNSKPMPCFYDHYHISFEYLLPYHDRKVFRKRYRSRSDSKLKGKYLRDTRDVNKEYDKIEDDD